MYLPSKTTQGVLFILLNLVFILPLSAQDSECELSPPTTASLATSATGYLLSWDQVDEALYYQITIVDTELGVVTFEEQTAATQIDIQNVSFSEFTYIRLASACANGRLGPSTYFAPESSTSTIIVQDIVMEFQGENGPRTLECETETQQIIAADYTGTVNTSFVVTPPVNTPAAYQIKGTIVEISLYEQATGHLFAQSTMLTQANNNLYTANDLTNVTYAGADYEFVSPANEHFYHYSNPVTGKFDFQFNANLPTEGIYQLVVEERYCPNVNKIKNLNGEDRSHGLRGHINNNTPVGYTPENKDNNKQELAGIRLYPNPTTHQIVLSTALKELRILDSQGRICLRATNTQPQQTIQVSHWPAGMYFLSAIRADGTPQLVRFQKL